MTLNTVTAVVLVSLLGLCRAADGQVCYTSGGVAGIVIATVVVTIVMGGLAVATIWYLWKQRSALSVEGKKKKKKPGSTFFSSVGEKNCVNLEQSSEKKKHPPEVGGKEAYAFDNPFFKDDETDRSKNPDAAEKGETGFRPDNGIVSNLPNNKVTASSKLKKSRPFSNLQFPNVFQQGFKKPRAMDDTFINKPLERIDVPLRGHDFTGLGFNICGNMRDGIFVKDVLHRGPASESGKIKAGDRIVGVWVSFGGMVYEDALTILSYASPYDVRLELEKTMDAKRNLALPASSPASKTRLVSSSFRTGQRLFHPLYRSQSFDDLTQIGKENHLPLNNNTGLATATNQNSCSSCPKRSQSIEAATSQKPRLQHEPTSKESRNSSTSSCESGKKGSPASAKVSAPKVEQSKKILAPDIKSPIIKAQSAPLQQVAPDLVSKLAVRSTLDAKPTICEVSLTDQLSKSEDSSSGQEDNKPTAPPRKVGAHIKRKAPAPPPKDSSKTETSAIVHRDAEEESNSTTLKELDNTTPNNKNTKSEVATVVTDVHSLSGVATSPPTIDDPTSSPKRKASSLGDLTTLDSAGHKKTPDTSTILERAVSLDFQQSLPEGNLVKQKMILKTPTFEDPEDTSEEDLTPSAGGDRKNASNLTRWEGTLSDIQDTEPPPIPAEDTKPERSFSNKDHQDISSNITNGHSESIDFIEDPESSYFAFDLPSEESRTQILITSTPVKNIIETERFTKDMVDIDDIPYIGIQEATTVINNSTKSDEFVGSPAVEASATPPPVPLTIPIIKPNMSQYEKLPSPEKSSNEMQSSSPGQESPVNDEQRQSILGTDIRSIESSYKPVFYSDSFRRERDNSIPEDSTVLSALDIVNGNGLDISTSSYAQYKTASENSSILESSQVETKLTKDIKKSHLPEITGIKVHGGAAGFAKTLIISTPIEGESISLNADLDSPPPKLEPPF